MNAKSKYVEKYYFAYFQRLFWRRPDMSSYWTSFFSSIFPPQSEEEVVRRENARVDHLIAEKKLRIKHLKKKVKARKDKRRKENFMKRMETLSAQVRMVHIEGLGRTSDE